MGGELQKCCCQNIDNQEKLVLESQQGKLLNLDLENKFFENEDAKDKKYLESTQSQFINFTQENIEKKLEVQNLYNKEQDEQNLKIQYLAGLVREVQQLKLRIIQSSTLPLGKELEITCQGLIGGCRNERDGFVYFGSKKRPKRIDKKVRRTEILNDFIVKNSEVNVDKRNRGRHFMIFFDLEKRNFQIRDLGIGYGCFKKINVPLNLRQNNLINFGSLYMIVNFIYKEQSQVDISYSVESRILQELQLRLKFYGKDIEQKIEYLFDPVEGREITMGRSQKCDISFQDTFLSKVQCKIIFKSRIGWVFQDGNGKQSSSNGSWIYLSDNCVIENGDQFKANQTVFEANVLNPQETQLNGLQQ